MVTGDAVVASDGVDSVVFSVVASELTVVGADGEVSVATVSFAAVVDSGTAEVDAGVLTSVLTSGDVGDVLASVASLDGAVVAAVVSSVAPVVGALLADVVEPSVGVTSLAVVPSVSGFVVPSDGVTPSVVPASRISVGLVVASTP